MTSPPPPKTTEPPPTSTELAPVDPNRLAVTLSWTVPSQLTTGEPLPLAEITGYEVYYASADGQIANVVAISGGSMTAAVVTTPAIGTYYFSIATVMANGEKSPLSEPVEVILK